MMLKIFTSFTNNKRGPLIYDPAEAKFVPSEHHIFGEKKCQLVKESDFVRVHFENLFKEDVASRTKSKKPKKFSS